MRLPPSMSIKRGQMRYGQILQTYQHLINVHKVNLAANSRNHKKFSSISHHTRNGCFPSIVSLQRETIYKGWGGEQKGQEINTSRSFSQVQLLRYFGRDILETNRSSGYSFKANPIQAEPREFANLKPRVFRMRKPAFQHYLVLKLPPSPIAQANLCWDHRGHITEDISLAAHSHNYWNLTPF